MAAEKDARIQDLAAQNAKKDANIKALIKKDLFFRASLSLIMKRK